MKGGEFNGKKSISNWTKIKTDQIDEFFGHTKRRCLSIFRIFRYKFFHVVIFSHLIIRIMLVQNEDFIGGSSSSHISGPWEARPTLNASFNR